MLRVTFLKRGMFDIISQHTYKRYNPTSNGNIDEDCRNFSKKGRFKAVAISEVQTVYIPKGKTILQYSGWYFRGRCLSTVLQIPIMTINGIHQVPMAQ